MAMKMSVWIILRKERTSYLWLFNKSDYIAILWGMLIGLAPC